MSESKSTAIYQREPLRSKFARSLVRLYSLRRGKDRFFMVLRAALMLPKFVNINLAPQLRLNVDLDDYLQRWIYCHRLAEEHDYNMIGKVLRDGDHFVDVGANIGIVTLIASWAVGNSGKVYAIEALPSTRLLLEENIRINDLQNVRVVPFALLDQNREVEFFASVDGNIGGSSMSDSGIKAKSVKVDGRTFDSLVADATIEGCDIMKMDIEGAEFLALKGMAGLFTTCKPRAVMIEISDGLLSQFSSTPKDIIDFFLRYGYEWFVARENGFEPLTNLDIKGFNNLWAIAPNGVDSKFII